MTTATKLNRRNWNTYSITGYTYQAGDDARATGGVHLHQVRQTRAGYWQTRVVDSNGRFQSAGKAQSVAAAEGETHLATAEAR
jgi:Neuraminidase (sialidase)